MQIIIKHPDYQHMVSSKTPEYMTFVDLRRVSLFRCPRLAVMARVSLTDSTVTARDGSSGAERGRRPMARAA